MAFECLDFYIGVFCFFIFQLQHEKAELEQHLEQEQEFQVNKLMKKIKKLENDTISKQLTLEQVKIYGSLSVSLIRIVLFFFFLISSTVLSNFKRSCGISVKNIFQLFLHTVGTSYLKYALTVLHSTSLLSGAVLFFLTTTNKVSRDMLWCTDL